MRTLTITALALAAGLLSAQSYEIDASHSAAVWGIQHLGLGNTWGRFNDMKGTIVFDAANPQSGSVSVVIPVASIDSANQKRDDHLRNADFFDAGTHPEMRFEGQGFQPVEGQENVFRVPGKLTIRGTTKPVELDVRLVGMGQHAMAKKPAIGFETEFTIVRDDYGVGQGDISKAVGQEVRVIVALEGIAK